MPDGRCPKCGFIPDMQSTAVEVVPDNDAPTEAEMNEARARLQEAVDRFGIAIGNLGSAVPAGPSPMERFAVSMAMMTPYIVRAGEALGTFAETPAMKNWRRYSEAPAIERRFALIRLFGPPAR